MEYSQRYLIYLDSMEDQIIKNAQYRKGLSIAFFNATNAAISLVSTGIIIPGKNELKDKIVYLRDWLLEEHKNYYKNVIENIGNNFNLEESIAKFGSVKSLEELRSVWTGLSEDERHNESIIKIKNELKRLYEGK